MQEVFEKIIEKLEELQNYACFPTEWVNEEQSKIHSYYANKLTEILKLTEQYNNGWIPCSDRLPEEHKLYDITFRNSAGIHSDSAIYNPYLQRWLWDADETELVENEVLAWAEKRKPYQPKGE